MFYEGEIFLIYGGQEKDLQPRFFYSIR